jgi:DNA-binding MarR family transcriptional regulator
MTPATDSISPETRNTLAGIFTVLTFFQKLDPAISLESVKAFLLIATNQNKSVHDYARMAGVGGGPMSRRISDLGELDRNLNPGVLLVESRPDPLDRRLTLVRLTSQGRAFANRVAATIRHAGEAASCPS